MKKSNISRRNFLRKAATVGTAVVAVPSNITSFSSEEKEIQMNKSSLLIVQKKSTGNKYYNALLSHPEFLKEHLGIKMAFCQHLMYMIADEDRGEPPLYERREPWGYPTAEKYVERIKRNLSSLAQNEGMKLNYQFAAVDLENIERNFPDAFAMIKKYYDNGQLDLIGGDFATAHQQVLSSESNWRQIEYGIDYYKRKFNKQITVYARQESSFHEQLPQILKKFGYKYIVPGSFPYHVEIDEGKFEMGASHLGSFFVHGDEFIQARSLDGSEIPFFLNIDAQAGQQEGMRKMLIQNDLYGSSPLWTYFPDLIEVDEKLFIDFNSKFDLIFLEDGLAERLKIAPPRAKGRIHSYWSYTGEGIWAEEHQRTVQESEKEALLAEGMNAMVMFNISKDLYSNELHDVWYTILKYQSHDVTWVEIQDLRRKSINAMKNGMVQCQNMAIRLGEELTKVKKGSISVFNNLPYKRDALIEVSNNVIPGSKDDFQEFKGKSYGFCELPAGGFASFKLSKNCEVSSEIPMSCEIKTDYYNVTLSKTGLIGQIVTRESKKLLQTGEYLGGEIRGFFDGTWKDNRKATCKLFDGNVAYILERSGEINTIPLTERYIYFKKKNLIKVELDFDFNHDKVGDYNLDKTKLNVYYPAEKGEMYRDIPYGYLEAREGRPYFATNWFYGNGLVYINTGTLKQWVANGVIANVLAWGGEGINNRIHYDFWADRSFDQSLNGKHSLQYYLIPVDKFSPQQIIRQVDNLKSKVLITQGQGEKSFYEIDREDIRVTATYVKGKSVRVRGYQLPSLEKQAFKDFEIFDIEYDSLLKQFIR